MVFEAAFVVARDGCFCRHAVVSFVIVQVYDGDLISG